MQYVCGRNIFLGCVSLLFPACAVQINALQNIALSSTDAVAEINVCEGLETLVPFAQGDGTAGSPFGICSKEQMNRVGSSAIYLDKSFKLLANIDLSSFTANSFTLIGTSAAPFVGTFDGNGKTISNFTYSSPVTSYIGLFRKLGYVGVIKNLAVESATITGGQYTGILVGEATGTVSGCHTKGTVVGTNRVGGMMGRYWGTTPDGIVENSYFVGNVSGTDFVGGITGWARNGVFTNNYSKGNISASVSRGGGLIGVTDGAYVRNCYADSVVTVVGIGAGGLIGASGGEISNSYSTGSVTGGDYSGGLSGWVNTHFFTGVGLVQNSYSLSTVTGRDSVGGLTGYSYAGVPIKNSYSRGTVSGRQYVGGFVGWAYGTILNSYSASSSITASLSDLGGITGGSGTTVTNSFWDVNTSGVVVSGHDNIMDGAGGATTVTLKTATTYTVPGWSTALWNINDGAYPVLK